MPIKLPGDTEITITVMTKKQRVLQDIQVFGTIKAVKRYMVRHNCGFKETFLYFNKIGAWPEQ